MHWKNLALLLLLLALPLAGCAGDENNGDEGDEGDGKPPAEMVGRWIYQSVTVDDAAANLATVLEWVPSAVAADIQVMANSAYVYQEVDTNGGQLWFESGFVFVGGNEIDVNAQQDSDGSLDETTFLTFTLVGDTLTLEGVENGMTVVFTLTRG